MEPEQPHDLAALRSEVESLRRRCAALERHAAEAAPTEEALRQSEARYRCVFDAGGDAIFVLDQSTGQILDANNAAIELYGYSLDELRRMTNTDVSAEPEQTAQALKEGLLHAPLRHHRKKDGSVFPVAITARTALLGGRTVSIVDIRDITERERANEALRFTQFVVDHGADGVVWIDPTTVRLIYVNEAVCRMLGYSRDDLRSMTLFDLDPDLTRSLYPGIWREIQERATLRFEVRLRAKDGHRVPIEVSANAIEFGGRQYDVAFWRDISDRKRAEEERRQLEAQVQHAQKLESLGVLAGGIAHDFNNLLTGVLGHADLALAHLSPVAPARHNIEEIEKAARRAADLCHQLLAYSGRGRFVVQALDLREVIEEMTHLLELSVSKKAVIRSSFAPGLPLLEADVTQIRQIVMNLIINASEAIGDRSGLIAITTGAMECDRTYLAGAWLGKDLPEGTYVYVEVADDGCGMDQETMARVFDPFFTTKFTGRGLGLAAVLGIVRGHRGAIKVASEPGRGTTFRVLLPALQEREVQLRREAEQAPEWHGSGMVLLVDDEDVVSMLGREILERLGFQTLVAANGREAIDVFRAHRDEIACVILDLTMPHLDGVETLQELRRLGAAVPVIMTSGYGEQDVTEQLAGEGIAGFLQKPFDLAGFGALLQRVLETPGGGGGTGA